MSIQQAMGTRDADFLEIHNAWARVEVLRSVPDDGAAPCYITGGDCERRTFATLASAMTFAYATLAEFQRGRAD